MTVLGALVFAVAWAVAVGVTTDWGVAVFGQAEWLVLVTVGVLVSGCLLTLISGRRAR